MGFLSEVGGLGGLGQALGGLGSLVGAFGGGTATNSSKVARQQYQYQKEFAQNGIQWRVNDAQKAGLHPLAALGAQGASYTPVAVTGGDSGGNRLGSALQGMGQALTGIQGYMDKQELKQRQEANDFMQYGTWATAIDKERAQIDLYKMEAAKIAMQMKQMAAPKIPSMPRINVGNDAINAVGQTVPIGQNSTQMTGVPAGDPLQPQPDFQVFYDRKGKTYLRPHPNFEQATQNANFLGWNYADTMWYVDYYGSGVPIRKWLADKWSEGYKR